MPGISAMALYVPPLRVSLADWCTWTASDWAKVETVVGDAFRVCPPDENAYTMAANAVLRMIDKDSVDPERVGFLGLGTESSTDNAAGAVIVKGMVNEALVRSGRPPLSRHCEVPEFKHACLGGVYGMKGALRYLACDGRGQQAIVVAADIAEYERGSSGEQTQGAGAVAMLLEEQPQLFEVALSRAASASDYRGFDFRKPFARHLADHYSQGTSRLHDFPIFNGRYSTFCYLDAVGRAFEAMAERSDRPRERVLPGIAAAFFHRPYHHLPSQAFASLWVRQLSWSERGQDQLRSLALEASVDPDALLAELISPKKLFAHAAEAGVDVDPFPLTSKTVRAARANRELQRQIREKTSLGGSVTRQLGNLYSASLPAWIGAGLEEAAREGIALQGQEMLAIGYGSGDAAEAWPLTVADGFAEAASRLGFAQALESAVDLTREQYEDLHDGRARGPELDERGFVVERVGEAFGPEFSDLGVEYYRYRAPTA